LSLAIPLIGLVMVNSAFGRVTALLAVITGILGILSIGGVECHDHHECRACHPLDPGGRLPAPQAQSPTSPCRLG
jgi:hypothetical protein